MDSDERQNAIQLRDCVYNAFSYYVVKTGVINPSQTTVLELMKWLSEKSEEI